MSHYLLLRLLNSEYSTTSIEINYLFQYPKVSGIQSYICNRLSEKPSFELQFYLPQLVHFIFVYIEDASFVKNLVLKISRKTIHFCLLCNWLLYSYYQDNLLNVEKSQLLQKFIRKLQAISNENSSSGDSSTESIKDLGLSLVQASQIFIGASSPKCFDLVNDMLQIQKTKFEYKKQTIKNIETEVEEKTYQIRENQNNLVSTKENQIKLRSVQAPSLEELKSGKGFDGPNPESKFVLALTEIANRLCLLPRNLRQSSLEAELTLINYNLPADICIPLWCSENEKDVKNHHKIVRISTKDSVVLNSADRAPFLIFVEVLRNKKGTLVHKDVSETPILDESQKQINTSIIPAESYLLPGSEQIPKNDEKLGNFSKNKNKQKDENSETMKTAAILLSQLSLNKNQDPKETNMLREKIIKEMGVLEEKRMEEMFVLGVMSSGIVNENNDIQSINIESNPEDDITATVFKENWLAKEIRIKNASSYGKKYYKDWELLPIIVKSGADLRQEQYAMQLIMHIKSMWDKNNLKHIYVKSFNIMVFSNECGLIEMIRNTISVHSLKKDYYQNKLDNSAATNAKYVYTLYDYFIQKFGTVDSPGFIQAQDNFMRSLVGYSVICYVLQIKDRHNGNILIDGKGHIIHIDFGFMLSNSPGSVGFESAPFKLTQEYIDILGGTDSRKFNEYRKLMINALFVLRNNIDSLISLIEVMQTESKLACFQMNSAQNNASSQLTNNVPRQLRNRLRLELTKAEFIKFTDHLIMSSCCNMFTRLYDSFQYYSNGIL